MDRSPFLSCGATKLLIAMAGRQTIRRISDPTIAPDIQIVEASRSWRIGDKDIFERRESDCMSICRSRLKLTPYRIMNAQRYIRSFAYLRELPLSSSTRCVHGGRVPKANLYLAPAATARSPCPTSAPMNGNRYCAGPEWRTNIISICYATPPPACSLPISTGPPSDIQTVMGHSSVQMTFDLYGHLFEDKEADREAMARLEAAVGVA
jgi:hypothetical protein